MLCTLKLEIDIHTIDLSAFGVVLRSGAVRTQQATQTPMACLLKCSRHTILPVTHDDVIKWKHFPRYWLFVQGIHRWPHKGQWRGALMFTLICAWMNGWVNNREAGDLIRHCAHYDVTIMHDHRLFGRGVDILHVMKENLFTPQTSKEQSICANDYDVY